MPELRVRLPLRAARGLLPGARRPGFVVCDRDARVLAAGRGVFELTGYRDADLIGRERRRGARALGRGADRRRPRVGRPEAGPGARDPDARRDREARRRGLLPRVRRRRRAAARSDARASRLSATIQVCLARASSSPSSAKSAVPAKSLRPSSPSGHDGDDARLAGVGDAVDARRHPAEHDVASALRSDRVGAGAVDRRPDDLGRGVREASSARHAAARGRQRSRRGSSRPSSARTPQTKHSRKSGLAAADVALSSPPVRPPMETGAGSLERRLPRVAPRRRARRRRAGGRASPSRSTVSGRSSGGGSRSVTSTSSASTNAASRPQA